MRWVGAIVACASVIAATPAAAATRLQNDDPAVAYDGAWYPIGNSAFDGGGAITAMDAGDRAILSFTGTAVRWIGYRDEWSGRANVYLDGLLQATLDTFASPFQARAVIWEATGLPAAGHTLTIEVLGTHNGSSGGSWVWIDAFDVDTASPPPGGGQEMMPPDPVGWQAFAARAGTAPQVATSTGADGYALQITGGGLPQVYGGWRTRIAGITGGTTYRLSGRVLPAAIASLRESVTILLRWTGSFGPEVVPDYVWDLRPAEQPPGAYTFERVIQAPAGSTAVDVELVLQWSADGRATFDRLSLAPAAAPAPRRVRVAAVYYRPSGTASGYESVQGAAAYAEQVAAAHRPDIIVLGEELNVIGAPGTLESKAETVPGPSTDLMAGVARRQGVNLVFGLLERAGDLLYHTAVLLDRNGAIAGTYRKVQLPLPDAYGGLSPGDSVPVFETDFGKVALLICQDTSFPEPAREAALQGAELLLVPIWGGKASLVRARAIENAVHLAASGYDYASEVIDPLGTVLATIGEITGAPKVAVADIDLGRRFRETWLGDWRDIANKERRSSPYRYRLP